MGRIALIGDYNPAVLAHQAIPLALERAGGEAGGSLTWTWDRHRFHWIDIEAQLVGYTGTPTDDR